MWNTPETYRIKLGGNYYSNCDDLIVAHGESLFRLRRREEDDLLAIDFDIYDAKGDKIATVRNGNIAQLDETHFTAHKEHHRYWVTEDGTDRVICDVRKASKAEDGSELEVTVDLYTKKGLHIIAGDGFTTVGTLFFSGNTMSNCGVGLVIK